MNNVTNYFTQLSSIDVSTHLEKKGQFSYLSWPYAVQQLRSFDEQATWAVQRFDGLPYLTTDLGTFVEVAVTVKGITLSQIHPVLDNKNKPLTMSTVFDINTSIQRCLVKAIALHGLGLKVYAGEDLPTTDGDDTSQAVTPTAGLQPAPFGKARAALEQHKQHHAHSTELLTANQLRYVTRLIHETGTDETQLLGFAGYDKLTEIPKSEVNRIIKMLEANRSQGAVL